MLITFEHLLYNKFQFTNVWACDLFTVNKKIIRNIIPCLCFLGKTYPTENKQNIAKVELWRVLKNLSMRPLRYFENAFFTHLSLFTDKDSCVSFYSDL